jgi:hypothetical protein
VKEFFAAIGTFILIIVGPWFLVFFHILHIHSMHPGYEQVRYNTFKESQTYNDGMIRDLENLQMEYMKSNDEQKAALKDRSASFLCI